MNIHSFQSKYLKSVDIVVPNCCASNIVYGFNKNQQELVIPLFCLAFISFFRSYIFLESANGCARLRIVQYTHLSVCGYGFIR